MVIFMADRSVRIGHRPAIGWSVPFRRRGFFPVEQAAGSQYDDQSGHRDGIGHEEAIAIRLAGNVASPVIPVRGLLRF